MSVSHTAGPQVTSLAGGNAFCPFHFFHFLFFPLLISSSIFYSFFLDVWDHLSHITQYLFCSLMPCLYMPPQLPCCLFDPGPPLLILPHPSPLGGSVSMGECFTTSPKLNPCAYLCNQSDPLLIIFRDFGHNCS